MIEAIMVISLIIILTSITVPGSLSALRSGRVNQAVSILETTSSDAQRFARSTINNTDGNFYGVRIEGGSPPHRVSVIYGNTVNAPAIDGLTKQLNANVLFYDGENVLTSNLVWFFQDSTGFPVTVNNIAGAAVSIGTSSSPIVESLSIRSTDGNVKVQCQIFEVGLFNREKFE